MRPGCLAPTKQPLRAVGATNTHHYALPVRVRQQPSFAPGAPLRRFGAIPARAAGKRRA
jgi:hypothetical protein